MKRQLLFWAALHLAVAALAQPRISFDETSHNFGQVYSGSGKVSHQFSFTNTGTEPLIISNAVASCGCTIPSWSKEPVQPGKTGYILAEFNPENRAGYFTKTIQVQSNHQGGAVSLNIKGTVVEGKALTEAKPVEYVQFFSYNKSSIVLGDRQFQQFVDKLVPVIKERGQVTIAIESSASNVPTKTYKDNNLLTRQRAEEARKKVAAALKAKGVADDHFKFAPDRTMIQGPPYNNDYNENAEIYERYQYVKVSAI